MVVARVTSERATDEERASDGERLHRLPLLLRLQRLSLPCSLAPVLLAMLRKAVCRRIRGVHPRQREQQRQQQPLSLSLTVKETFHVRSRSSSAAAAVETPDSPSRTRDLVLFARFPSDSPSAFCSCLPPPSCCLPPGSSLPSLSPSLSLPSLSTFPLHWAPASAAAPLPHYDSRFDSHSHTLSLFLSVPLFRCHSRQSLPPFWSFLVPTTHTRSLLFIPSFSLSFTLSLSSWSLVRRECMCHAARARP